ncbi:MAG: hypothetical protein Q3966_07575, partial [Neisseria sp.]|nr:hypothetical protein [Neisseria sp.]
MFLPPDMPEAVLRETPKQMAERLNRELDAGGRELWFANPSFLQEGQMMRVLGWWLFFTALAANLSSWPFGGMVAAMAAVAAAVSAFWRMGGGRLRWLVLPACRFVCLNMQDKTLTFYKGGRQKERIVLDDRCGLYRDEVIGNHHSPAVSSAIYIGHTLGQVSEKLMVFPHAVLPEGLTLCRKLCVRLGLRDNLASRPEPAPMAEDKGAVKAMLVVMWAVVGLAVMIIAFALFGAFRHMEKIGRINGAEEWRQVMLAGREDCGLRPPKHCRRSLSVLDDGG